jgi:hypothetical protein
MITVGPCPVCNLELPDYFNLGLGVISITVRCPTCNASIGLSRAQSEPHVVSYDVKEDPRYTEAPKPPIYMIVKSDVVLCTNFNHYNTKEDPRKAPKATSTKQ